MNIVGTEAVISSLNAPRTRPSWYLSSTVESDKLQLVSSIPASPLVLLVDDFDDARELYADYLEFRGYRIVTASSGPEALTIARLPDRPALILMDLRMFGMSGGETMRILRGEPEFAEVPIVAFTAHALDNEREAAIFDGFDAVITKPCLPDELAALIDQYLSKRLGARA